MQLPRGKIQHDKSLKGIDTLTNADSSLLVRIGFALANTKLL